MIISPVSEQTFPLRPNQLPRSSVDWNERLLNRGIPDIETDENFQTTTGSGVVEVTFINQFSFVYTFSTFERNFCLTRIFLLLARFSYNYPFSKVFNSIATFIFSFDCDIRSHELVSLDSLFWWKFSDNTLCLSFTRKTFGK